MSTDRELWRYPDTIRVGTAERWDNSDYVAFVQYVYPSVTVNTVWIEGCETRQDALHKMGEMLERVLIKVRKAEVSFED